MFGTNIFGIGMPELIFIAIIALVVLGPQRLPGMLRELAKLLAQLRGLASELTSQFSEEIAMIEELDPRKLMNEVTQPINDLTKPLPKNKSVSKQTAEQKAAEKSTNNTAKEKSSIQSQEPESRNGDLVVGENGAQKNNLDAKNGYQPQVQTNPSNVASTEPYKNRTPNLGVIKKPTQDEASKSSKDAESSVGMPEVAQLDSDSLDDDPVEENRIAPPTMQEKIAKSQSIDVANSTKQELSSNGDNSSVENMNSDSSAASSDTPTNPAAES